MTVSVVIPAHNEEAYIADCIESVLRHAVPELLEIVVVCNACTDRTAEIAGNYERVKVVHEPRQGTGFARQKGLEETTGELVAFLDADTRIHEQWFPTALVAFEADASLASLSGPYKFYDLHDWRRAMVGAWWTAAIGVRRRGMILGGNVVVRRAALDAIGGFDTSIPFWGDDTNLAERLASVGGVRFSMEFFGSSSARRLKGQGFVATGGRYVLNHVSQALLRKTLTRGSGSRPWEARIGAGSTRP